MAITVRKDPQAANLPGLKVRTYEIDFDSSYPAGGEVWDLSADFDVIKGATFESEDGYTFKLTSKDAPASSKIQAFSAIKKYTATFDAASLAATTSRDDAIAVTGVASDDECVKADLPDAAAASIAIQNARVTAAAEITVRLTNPSAAAVDLASGTYKFYVTKKAGAYTEVADTTDLSAVTKVGAFVWGTKS